MKVISKLSMTGFTADDRWACQEAYRGMIVAAVLLAGSCFISLPEKAPAKIVAPALVIKQTPPAPVTPVQTIVKEIVIKEKIVFVDKIIKAPVQERPVSEVKSTCSITSMTPEEALAYKE